MHKTATKLCVLFLLAVTSGPAAAQGAPTDDAAAQHQTAQIEQLCDYCQDYTDAAVAAGPIQTAYQVGIGYPDEKRVAEVSASQQR
jgi:hypothetical protein